MAMVCRNASSTSAKLLQQHQNKHKKALLTTTNSSSNNNSLAQQQQNMDGTAAATAAGTTTEDACLHCFATADQNDIQVRCDECSSYICSHCHWCHEFQANHEIRVCDRCDAFYCRACDEMDQCDDCGEVVCAACSTLLSCKFCGGGLCEDCATACGRYVLCLSEICWCGWILKLWQRPDTDNLLPFLLLFWLLRGVVADAGLSCAVGMPNLPSIVIRVD